MPPPGQTYWKRLPFRPRKLVAFAVQPPPPIFTPAAPPPGSAPMSWKLPAYEPQFALVIPFAVEPV